MRSITSVLPWRRLLMVARPFWVSEARKVGIVHLMAVLALLALHAAVAVFINKSAGRFMTALESKSLEDFYFFLCAWVLAILVSTPIQVFYGYLRTRLALIWREWLSTRLLEAYFAGRTHVHLAGLDDIDNPEQRMTQDVDSFCNSSVGLFISILDACINVVTFITVLWVISPNLSFTVMIYASLGFVIVTAIGKSLVGLNFEQMKREAHLRAGLTSARNDASQIAAGGHEDEILSAARSDLRAVISTLLDIALVNRNLQLFTTPFNLLVQIIPAVLVAPAYFDGLIPFGTITQAVMAFGVVFNGATVLIVQFNGITSYAAITNRLGSLMEAMEGSERRLKMLSKKG